MGLSMAIILLRTYSIRLLFLEKTCALSGDVSTPRKKRMYSENKAMIVLEWTFFQLSVYTTIWFLFSIYWLEMFAHSDCRVRRYSQLKFA